MTIFKTLVILFKLKKNKKKKGKRIEMKNKKIKKKW